MKLKFKYLIKYFILVMVIGYSHNDTFAYFALPGTVPTPGLSEITKDECDFKVSMKTDDPLFINRKTSYFYYKINSDSLSVSMISSYSQNGGTEIMAKAPLMDDIVTNPEDGKEYILTSLGNNCRPLLLTHFTISPNIRRLEAYALEYVLVTSITQYYSYAERYMDENTEFDYVGLGGLNASIMGNYLKIADNGELHTISYVPSIIKLGKNVKLKSVESVFTKFPSDSICQLYSYSEDPPLIETYRQILSTDAEKYTPEPKAELFSSDNCYKAEHSTLYVPAGCKEAYAADPEWGRFENIVEMEPVALEEIIADEEQGISISTDLGQIYVRSTEDREVLVFAMSGLLLKRDHTRDRSVRIELQPGAYLVKVGDKFIRKVAVK